VLLRKFSSVINYNKIIGYKFNSSFYNSAKQSSLAIQRKIGCLSAPPANFYFGDKFCLPLPCEAEAVAPCEAGRGSPLGGDGPLGALGGSSGRQQLQRSRDSGKKGSSLNIGLQPQVPQGPENIASIAADTYKLLFYLFKSMYCLISKPVLKYTNDKVTIQLFYYLNIPKKKVFRLFSIYYINSIKKKWLALIEKKKPIKNPLAAKAHISPTRGVSSPPTPGSFVGGKAGHPSMLSRVGGNPKIFIRWKLRKAISRFKNKFIQYPVAQQHSLFYGANPPCFGDLTCKAGGEASQQYSNKKDLHITGGGSPLVEKNLLFKLRKFNLSAVYQNKFKLICAILSNKFNKPVELQLIRLHHPYHDSNILVNLLSLNIKNKRKKARVAVQKIYNKKPLKFFNDPFYLRDKHLAKNNNWLLRHSPLYPNSGKNIPAFLSGLNIKIAGRLMGEPIIPRITSKVFSKGATATGKVNYLDVARITKKNRKGAYTIKITSGQNFFL
jgi:Mitochondrial ribosomal protein (VAR1)